MRMLVRVLDHTRVCGCLRLVLTFVIVLVCALVLVVVRVPVL